MRKFIIPQNAREINVNIIDDFDTLLNVLHEIAPNAQQTPAAGIDYVILPLYGRNKNVFEKSGLNQWNAAGRPRDLDEMYIPIPSKIRNINDTFFPPRDTPFNLKVPTGEILSAKLCQENNKALMTNPNKAIADWLLRKILKLNSGELATYERLQILGVDSVIITRDENSYKIDIMPCGSYEKFLKDLGL